MNLASTLATWLLCCVPACASAASCVPAGRWVEPGAGEIPAEQVFAQASQQTVLLLGEKHDVAAHHQWQLDTLRTLKNLRPQLVIGLEMLPRSAQPVLDAWVRGELDEVTLFRLADWNKAWGVPSALYVDIFRFAREQRIPMHALNIDRSIVREVSRSGLAGVPRERREGVGDPAAPDADYRAWLEEIWRGHVAHARGGDAARERFIEGQLLWDRAMAEALADAARSHPQALVIGLMGSGHIVHGHGVEHQLRALGLPAVGSLLPWDDHADCDDLVRGLADGVYGLESPRHEARQ
ncbi:ChaN family lipoprotein [Methyloversatilis thermotolerans]|uniref:ChaN family lipoprotein n=1 Tax=Methyloversatilis thermotolerans TaxID=1346290 RepID=UPI00037C34FE|nr:ChaN family lipoprotein [Methyloversatilis thermotolerans]